jgi:MoaA/NifB/PqqE/SkfB family radical SAM enzyme
MLQRCVDAGGHDISISLDSLDAATQDVVNGGFDGSWERAIRTISVVNKIFPDNGTAFFGTVLMPRNLEHIGEVVEFASEIGWGVSVVPVHLSTPDKPRGFRSFDDSGACTFPSESYPRVKEVLRDLKQLRVEGQNLYDSDEYLDDIYRFVVGEPVRWRRRNNDVCDSPSLYFAVEPNGNINPCCDFKLGRSFPVYAPDFVERYRSGEIHGEVGRLTRSCDGCMYGSYPEITVTARFLKPLFERFLFFNTETHQMLKKCDEAEIREIARDVHSRHEQRRQEHLRNGS